MQILIYFALPLPEQSWEMICSDNNKNPLNQNCKPVKSDDLAAAKL